MSLGAARPAPPLVSVVLPTYNRAGVVGRAIRSVLGQTLGDLELIVVDDGSTDGTDEALQASGDPRLRLIRLPDNRGACRARNAGISAARGEWVAFLDSDDEWLPRKLECQLARLTTDAAPRPTVAYCYSRRRDDMTGRDVPQRARAPEPDIIAELLLRANLLTSQLVIERASLVAAGGFDEALPALQEYDLCLRLAVASHRFVAVNERLVIRHDLTGSQISDDPEALIRASRIVNRRWAPLVRSRLGARGYRRWRATGHQRIQLAHLRRIRRAVSLDDRRAAWRSWVAMWRYLPWSRRPLAQGLVLLLLGAGAYAALLRLTDRLRAGGAGAC